MTLNIPFVRPEGWSPKAQLLYAFLGPLITVTLFLTLTGDVAKWPRYLVGGIGAGLGCALAVSWSRRNH